MSLPSGLPENIADGESIVRFLTSSGYFNTSGAKDRAFLPNPKDGKTSVSREGDCSSEKLKVSAADFFPDDRKLHGVGILKAKAIRETQLDLESEEPPPRHANIIKWPWVGNDPELLKAERKELAKVLASKAKTVLF